MYPYRPILVQELSNSDMIFRCEAARSFLDTLPRNLSHFFFTDEATFSTDGTVNRWNCRIWSVERPETFSYSRSQNVAKITVWAALSSNYLFGPYFFPSTVTGESYRDILKLFFIPNLVETLGEEATGRT